MAKQDTTTKEEQLPSAPATSQVPAFLQEQQMTGAGVSSSQDDILIPIATILQSNSPQVQRGTAGYVEGAAAGDIYMKNAPQPLLQGDLGFLFQACFFSKAIVEWKPRNAGGGGGQGFVARHDFPVSGAKPDDGVEGRRASWPRWLQEDSEERTDPQNPERTLVFRKSTGNVLVDTRYEAGFAVTADGSAPPLPLVLPFASTGHSVHRAWMLLMNQKMVKGAIADSYSVYYRIKTRMRSRGAQNWFVFDIADAGPLDAGHNRTTMWVPTVADYERGKALYEALQAGAMKFGEEESSADDVGPSDEARAKAAGV